MPKRVSRSFFLRDVLEVAPDLLGKYLVRNYGAREIVRFEITEVEAYRGISDLACHASKGRTPRTDVMFMEGGLTYVYFIYGMYWMLNLVTGCEGDASAVLIRGVDYVSGPGRVGKILKLDRSFYGEDVTKSERLWLEDGCSGAEIVQTPRIGIGYAGEPWISMPWRYVLKDQNRFNKNS
jgi:DNA-3-methyladenine glycosylase